MSIDHESLIRIRDSAEQLYSQEKLSGPWIDWQLV